MWGLLRSGYRKTVSFFTGSNANKETDVTRSNADEQTDITRSNADEQTEPVQNFIPSDPVIPPTCDCTEEVERVERLADAVKKKSQSLSQAGSLSVYKIPLKEERINIKGCRRFTFGRHSTKHNRTIMVLGATGAGKSTLINGMINYILGVEWKDEYRFKLVDEGQSKSQAHSQTSEVTAYKINHQKGFKIEYSLTIIDTPGFGDTRGIERDREIVEQLRNLFSNHRGVSEIDAVCFVVQSALARLTPSQKYVFDSILSIFGKDVAENIRILVTFADGQRPPVLEAIRESGVPCPKTDDELPVHFKFNNSALFADNKSSVTNSTGDDDEDGGFDEMFWNMGTKSMKKFFAALNVIQTKSLTLTNEVLKERRQLEDSVEDLQKKVKLGLAKLEEINETSKKLKDHEAEMNRNENFEIEITVTKPYQHDISGTGHYITNCQVCHYTCHYPCTIADDKSKIYCAAMSDGSCIWCPNKCQWNVHFNQKYKWEYKEVKEKQTLQQLKEKYLKATGKKATVQGVIDKLKDEYDRLHAVVLKLIEKSSKCLNRLKEIALKPNPLSTPDYIDMLIEGEKSEGKPGWKKRVDSLVTMKERAEFMAKVEKGDSFLKSPPSQVQHCNQGQTKNSDSSNTHEISNAKIKTNANRDQDKKNNGIKNQDETETDSQAQDKSITVADEDKEKTNTDHDKAKTNADQDEAKTNKDQDEPKSNADQDEAKTNADKNEVKTEVDQDEVKTNTDQDEAKNEVDQDEVRTNTDQDEAKTNTDQDEVKASTDKDEAKTNTDKDEAKTNTDQDEAKNEVDQDEVRTNTDQDEAKTNTDQDEVKANTDQDEEKTNTDQDEVKTEVDQDEVKTTTDQDEAKTEVDQDKAASGDS